MRIRSIGPLVFVFALLLLPTLVGGTSEGNCVPIPVEPECAGEGETVPVVPDAMECCAGLVPISIAEYDEATGMCMQAVGAVVCAACGDGECGVAENVCNCPEDCTEQPTCLGQGETYPVIPNRPECCEGLHGGSMYEVGPDGECIPLDGAGICIACGDGVCGDGEDICNCAEDCGAVTDCVAAGDGFAVVPPFPSCCPGLVAVGCDAPAADGSCMGCDGYSYCVACGDGVCGAGENICRCPEDCR